MTTPIPINVSGTDLVPLFPTYLWRTRLEPATYEPINERIQPYLNTLEGSANQEEGSKLQTEQHLHLSPELSDLVRIINGAVDSILDFLKAKHEGFVITGCWANLGARGSGHKMHAHPNNFLSGVYYVRAPEGGNLITFHDPRPQPSIVSPPPSELTASNAGKVDFHLNTGDMIIFPSWLNHSVPPNTSDDVRVSIAFNVMFKEFVEQMSPPRWKGGLKLRSSGQD